MASRRYAKLRWKPQIAESRHKTHTHTHAHTPIHIRGPPPRTPLISPVAHLPIVPFSPATQLEQYEQRNGKAGIALSGPNTLHNTYLNKPIHPNRPTNSPPPLHHPKRHARHSHPPGIRIRPLDLKIQLVSAQPHQGILLIGEQAVFDTQGCKNVPIRWGMPADVVRFKNVDCEWDVGGGTVEERVGEEAVREVGGGDVGWGEARCQRKSKATILRFAVCY